MKSVGSKAHNAASSGKSLIPSAAIIIPTCNAAPYWEAMHAGLERQRIGADRVLVIDSSSSDNTRELVQHAGYRLKVIPRSSFRHGATRQMAAELLGYADLLVYLTQDAIPFGENPIGRLLEAFRDPLVGAAYGRQMPRPEAFDIERHARLFNYPDVSITRDFESRKTLGIRAAFFSNSFAAYRKTAFDQVGGFAKQSIVSEEVTLVARMLMAGWKASYQSEATVIHSHPLTVASEFSRYFDIGVHHGREKWLLDAFGTAAGEGRKFVLSEMRYLGEHNPRLIPLAVLRTATKLCGYKLGRYEAYLPRVVKERLSAQASYWRDDRDHAFALHSYVASARR